MSSSRKKMDEKHLKILRELASLPANKYCFDCRQRGPTYVNVTIGSFVCTKCSGILRGLTPPHRVKSISMATFTQDEIDLLTSRGNEYCQKIWLRLSDQEPPTKDEQQIKDFMVDKYEKKRFYVEPGTVDKSSVNGKSSSQNTFNSTNGWTSSHTTLSQRPIQVNGLRNDKAKSPASNGPRQVLVNGFDSPAKMKPSLSSDLFDPQNQPSFANFENNPIYNAATETSGNSGGPSEDRYAALKDLDCMMKSQITQPEPVQPANTPATTDVNSTNGFWTFPSASTPPKAQTSLNPFSNGAWNFENTTQTSSNSAPFGNGNPFKDPVINNEWAGVNNMTTSQSLGAIQSSVQMNYFNPFVVGSPAGTPATGNFHSSNPFL